MTSSVTPEPLAETPSAHPASPIRRPAWQRLLPVLLIVAFAWLVITQFNRALEQPRLRPGDTLPPLTLTTFDGDTLDLAALRGQGLVINFWASWCIPCRAEMPLFESTWQAEREHGIVFIGVNLQDTPAAAHAFLAEFNVTYPNGEDLPQPVADDPSATTTWARRFDVSGLPTTFFIAPDGVIQSVVLGPVTSPDLLAEYLATIRPAAATP